MPKRKRKPEEGAGPAPGLEGRLTRLERVIAQHFGAGIEELAEENPGKDTVVEETEFDRSIVRKYASGKIEHLRKCAFCRKPVHDLTAHEAVCRRRPAY